MSNISTKKEKIVKKILTHIKMIDPNGDNYTRYKEMFENMNDAAFDQYMELLREGKTNLHIYAPNMKKSLNMQSIIKAAESLGLKLTERIWMYDASLDTWYLTNEPYLVLKLPIRRTAQILEKKRSLPAGDKKIDQLSGQVTSDDRAAGISVLEQQIYLSLGLKHTTMELVKVRGGDISAYADYKRSLLEEGRASVTLESTGSVARSAMIYEILLRCCMLESNIVSNQ